MLNIIASLLIAQAPFASALPYTYATTDGNMVTTPYLLFDGSTVAPDSISTLSTDGSLTIHEKSGDITISVKGRPTKESINDAEKFLDGFAHGGDDE